MNCYRKTTFLIKVTLLKKQVVYVEDKSCPYDLLLESSIGITRKLYNMYYFSSVIYH